MNDFNCFRGSYFPKPIASHKIHISKINNKVEFVGAIPNRELSYEHISVVKLI